MQTLRQTLEQVLRRIRICTLALILGCRIQLSLTDVFTRPRRAASTTYRIALCQKSPQEEI